MLKKGDQKDSIELAEMVEALFTKKIEPSLGGSQLCKPVFSSLSSGISFSKSAGYHRFESL